MRVYGDSITLWNDGTLPANYTIKTLFKRHESRPRNKLIANVFYLAGFIEAWGRGYEKIRDAFKAENLEMPVFEEVRGGFMATVKREKFVAIQGRKDVAKDVIKDVTKDVIKEISDRQLVVYGLIKENPFVTIAEMSQKTGVASRTIIRDLEYLQSRGMLVREGGRKEGHWIIIGEI
jgi:ATP-dependent DNA helicase RecG